MSALGHTRAHWSGVLAMTLCVFVLIASEFMPVSLLTPIAGDLHITEGLAGQGIALSGALAVLTSLTISRLTGSLDRKWLLLGLTALMAASGVIIALASSFPVYMLGRALIGIVIGGFWSMSAATAIRLVPQRQVPRALAIFNGGNALATVVAAPLGSYLSAQAEAHPSWKPQTGARPMSGQNQSDSTSSCHMNRHQIPGSPPASASSSTILRSERCTFCCARARLPSFPADLERWMKCSSC